MPQEHPSAMFEEMNKVVELHLKNKSPHVIAKQLGLRKVDVERHIDTWRKSALGSEMLKERVEQLIVDYDSETSMLIEKAHEIIDEVDDLGKSGKETMTRSQMLSQKRAAVDLAAKLSRDRIDVLQKSGLLDAADVTAELEDVQKRFEQFMDLIQDTLCEDCLRKVMGAVAEQNGSVVIVAE